MCLISGEPKCLKNSRRASISRGGQNFQKPLKTHLENVVKNKCTEFEQNRSTGNVFNFGGTKRSGEEEKKKKKKPVLDQKMAYFEQS